MTKESPRNEKFSFAIAALRRAGYRWPAFAEAMRRARQERGVYLCRHCKGLFGRKEVQKDHIKPVVPLTGWDSFDGFIDRLLCKPDDIQILCKPCHKAKSKGENVVRRKYKTAT